MTILNCGTLVTTKLNKINGMITASTIRFDAVIYEITYGDDFKTVYMRRDEFDTIGEVKTLKLGFEYGQDSTN